MDEVRFNGGDIITITRQIDFEVGLSFVVRPYTNKSYNCAGCRKRHHANKHVLKGTNTGYRSRPWWIYPKIFTCGSEVCFNMAILRYNEKLSRYKNIIAEPYTGDYTKCANCTRNNRSGHGTFLQAFRVYNGKEKKYATYCCMDCFKMSVSKPLLK